MCICTNKSLHAQKPAEKLSRKWLVCDATARRSRQLAALKAFSVLDNFPGPFDDLT